MSKLNAIRSIPGIKACVTLQNRPRSRPLAGISSGVCHVWTRRKNLAPSQVTAKGHMRRPRQGLCSARRNQTGTQTFVDTSITPIPATVSPPHTVQMLQARERRFVISLERYNNYNSHFFDCCMREVISNDWYPTASISRFPTPALGILSHAGISVIWGESSIVFEWIVYTHPPPLTHD
jgi:hypothetical protein